MTRYEVDSYPDVTFAIIELKDILIETINRSGDEPEKYDFTIFNMDGGVRIIAEYNFNRI